MAIRNGERVVAGVRYSLIWLDEAVDIFDFATADGCVEDLIEKVKRNPGMSIVAETYHHPEEGGEVVTSRRVVFA